MSGIQGRVSLNKKKFLVGKFETFIYINSNHIAHDKMVTLKTAGSRRCDIRPLKCVCMEKEKILDLFQSSQRQTNYFSDYELLQCNISLRQLIFTILIKCINFSVKFLFRKFSQIVT